MKYIKLFNTDSEYQEFASSAAQPIPNVSYVTETDEVHYNESDPILFAYEYQSDKFVMGVVIGSDIYVDTYETGFIVADGSGKFSTALAYTNDDLINIQNAIKDHYHLAASTIKTKAPLIEYAVGDTVPNWNAYEKIEMPHTYIAVTNGGDEGPFAFGELKDNDEIVFESFGENIPYLANTDGVVVVKQYGFPQVFTDLWKPKIDAALGINSTASTVISSLNLEDTVPNWDKYQKIV